MEAVPQRHPLPSFCKKSSIVAVHGPIAVRREPVAFARAAQRSDQPNNSVEQLPLPPLLDWPHRKAPCNHLSSRRHRAIAGSAPALAPGMTSIPGWPRSRAEPVGRHDFGHAPRRSGPRRRERLRPLPRSHSPSPSLRRRTNFKPAPESSSYAPGTYLDARRVGAVTRSGSKSSPLIAAKPGLPQRPDTQSCPVQLW
jgi:hypothetical protein